MVLGTALSSCTRHFFFINCVHFIDYSPNVNRSTYYKHFYSLPSSRAIENQNIKQMILHIYADYDKRIGAYKIAYILGRDYGICISVGRVYRLMRSM